MESHLQSELGSSDKKDGKSKKTSKDDDESVKSDKTPRGWSNVQLVLNQSNVYDDKNGGVVLLDTDSTMSIFHDPNWVEDINISSSANMATNARIKNVNKKGNVPGFGEV